MSTTKIELEQLRLARQAAREAEEARLKQEALEAAEVAKKDAFRKRAELFTQKQGPSEEEIIENIRKEEQKRKFTRKLNRLLRDDPDENPITLEYRLKNGIELPNSKDGDDNDDGSADWELIEEEGVQPYYWNRRTNISTYDSPFESKLVGQHHHQQYSSNSDDNGDSNNGGGSGGHFHPPPPPPPPPRRLVGLKESKDIAWMKVIPEDGSRTYYWNKYTNESKYDEPTEYLEYDVTTMTDETEDDEEEGNQFENQEDGEEREKNVREKEEREEGNQKTTTTSSSSSSNHESSTVHSLYDVRSTVANHGGNQDDHDDLEDNVHSNEIGLTWEETIDPDSGEICYIHQNDDETTSSRMDKPEGTTYIVVPAYVDDEGIEHTRESWEEVVGSDVDTDGNEIILTYYKSLVSAEITSERPIGQVIIVEEGEENENIE